MKQAYGPVDWIKDNHQTAQQLGVSLDVYCLQPLPNRESLSLYCSLKQYRDRPSWVSQFSRNSRNAIAIRDFFRRNQGDVFQTWCGEGENLPHRFAKKYKKGGFKVVWCGRIGGGAGLIVCCSQCGLMVFIFRGNSMKTRPVIASYILQGIARDLK